MNTDDYNFDDIKPLDDGSPDGLNDIVLCRIMYTPDFKMVFSYLRTLMAKKEYSKRALYVTTYAISLVPAHYTVWSYRFDIVKELFLKNDYNIEDELKWCDEIAINNEKNYQIWQYRELLIKLLIKEKFNNKKSKYDLDLEYKIINQMLNNDEKNYHVWSHKRWIVEYFDLFNNEKELKYTELLLENDIRNNSAWNFRNFIIFGGNQSNNIDPEIILKEIDFTIKGIRNSISNPSSWNYIKFLYSLCKTHIDDKKLNQGVKKINEIVREYTCKEEEIQEALSNNKLSVPAFELLSEIYRDEGESEKMKRVYKLLGEELDPVRKNYWNYKISV